MRDRASVGYYIQLTNQLTKRIPEATIAAVRSNLTAWLIRDLIDNHKVRKCVAEANSRKKSVQ